MENAHGLGCGGRDRRVQGDEEWDIQVKGPGGGMADAKGQHERSENDPSPPLSNRRETREGTIGGGGDLGDSQSGRREGRGLHLRPGEQGETEAIADGAIQAMGNTKVNGLEGRNGGMGESDEIPTWPPGPTERDRWERILARWPQFAPAIESPIRRVANGYSSRVDRLRACGNAVVPAVACEAFKVLYNRMKECLEKR